MRAALIASALIGSLAAAQPVESNSGSAPPADFYDGFTLSHDANQVFPQSKANLSAYNFDSLYSGYNSSEEAWLKSLNPATGKTDDEKARTMAELAYIKPYNEADQDMVEFHDELLAAVEGKSAQSSLQKRASFSLSGSHAVKWATCAGALSCYAGYTCKFSQTINKAPRSVCKKISNENCCLSWSTYTVKAGFFERTWTNCNSEVSDEKKSSASCEGHGGSAQGGDVCISNRATGCT